ncbi:MAG: MBOAT family protein [Verrucomicrobiota bacterium]
MSAPAWAIMWAISVVIFVLCKAVSWKGRGKGAQAPLWRKFAYLVMWPGLNARAFLCESAQSPQLREWVWAAAKTLFGAAMIWGVVRWIPAEQQLLIAWVGMIGMIFLLHFGSFHLISCFWRTCGISAQPLMRNPVAATSVSEFWSDRWNLAFRDLSNRFLFRPIAKRFGVVWGTIGVFVFSGVVHDIVISIPAAAGFGLPTLYFIIQAAAVFIERSKFGKRIGLTRGWRGWLFTLVAVLSPVGWLFHRPFAEDVIVPFLEAIFAIPS